jgi:hypothetical protein
MRITVGGLLVILGAGSVGAVFFMPSGTAPTKIDNYIHAAREKINTSLGLFRSASTESASEAPPLASESPQDVQSSTPVTTIPVAAPPATASAPVPVVETSAVTKKAVKKLSKRRARRKVAKKNVAPKATTAVIEKASAKPAAVKPVPKSGGSLVGSEVVLTLNTGREVRGVLQGQDAIAYKVELPGLGAFTYPIQNVKSIRTAE